MSDIQPNKIYDFVLKAIEQMKSHTQNISDDSVGASSDEGASIESKVRKEQLAQAQELLQGFESSAIKSVEDYKNVAEFDTFTIAFYGETNAGKSTIIEALRIYFGEESKQNERTKFDKFYKRFKWYNEGFWGKIFAFFTPSLKTHTLKNLLDSSDGAIIGDGRADFTRQSSTYHFNYKDTNFDILDMPGIEGNEKVVIGEILKATKKAHCVFYITRDAKPPQKGDSPNGDFNGTQPKGTIGKIKEHLGAQTEVYSIFNKSVTSPNAISDSIIQPKDENGLNDLDSKMKYELGEHYIGRKILSAQVAFYALGEKVFDIDLPNSDDEAMKKAIDLAKKRDKFINVYPKDELLQKSLFLDFARFISDDLAQNVGEKIKKSNFNKAYQIVLAMSDMLKSLHDIYNELYRKCNVEVGNSRENLERIADGANGAFKRASDGVVDEFISEIRIDIYDFIKQNVKDSVFEAKFKQIIENKQKDLNDKFQTAFDKVEKDIQGDIEIELENFERRMGNIAKEFQSISINNNFDSNLNINIDSGVDKWGLLSVGAGVAGLIATQFWNPIGWVAIAFSVAAIALGAYKSLRKFFSDDYKMSQQRKAVDENLRKIRSDIQKISYESIDKQIKENLKPYIKSLQDTLQLSVVNLKETSEYFRALREKEVIPLANQIKKEGGL